MPSTGEQTQRSPGGRAAATDDTSDVESAARSAWATMAHLFMQSAGRIEGIAATLGLTPTDMKALLHLERGTAPSQGELAEHWRCDASWVTAKVDSLEASGLVTRVPDPRDRRRKTVVLSPEGERVQSTALEHIYEPPAALTALDDDDLRTLARVLAKVELVDGDLVPGARHLTLPRPTRT